MVYGRNSVNAIYGSGDTEVIAYGSIVAETSYGSYIVQTLGKTGIDATAQFLISGDVNWLNAVAGSVLPGKVGNYNIGKLSPLTTEVSQSYQDFKNGELNFTKTLLRTGTNFIGQGLGATSKLVGQDNGFNAVQSFIFENGIQSFHNNGQGEMIRQNFENSK